MSVVDLLVALILAVIAYLVVGLVASSPLPVIAALVIFVLFLAAGRGRVRF